MSNMDHPIAKPAKQTEKHIIRYMSVGKDLRSALNDNSE